MKAQILQHKKEKGINGYITRGKLYRTGSGLVPQLFSEYITMKKLAKIIRETESPLNYSLEHFKLVNVEILIK